MDEMDRSTFSKLDYAKISIFGGGDGKTIHPGVSTRSQIRIKTKIVIWGGDCKTIYPGVSTRSQSRIKTEIVIWGGMVIEP